MTGYIANTDAGWFEFLRQQPPQPEVNFWNPSDFYMFRGAIGSPFLFRLKSPVNKIGGFGVVSWADRMPECAVTNEHSLPALEAAHIRPYGEGGEHDIRNGLLLRSDLHRLFDRGYVTVTPKHILEVSRSLKEDFGNGRSYDPHHGCSIALPQRPADLPDPDLLRWHNDSVFRA